MLINWFVLEMLAGQIASTKGETCSGGKRSKERRAVLVCANMDGSQKLPLLVTGKFARPRCFKNARTLPVQYESNTKAWMVGNLFSSWPLKLDKQFQHEHRKVAMVLDNCPAHLNIQDALKAVKLVFLPPNTASKLQPCDQGVIQNMKVHYRKFLLIRIITTAEAKEVFSPSLLDSLYTLRLVWDDVRPEIKTVSSTVDLSCQLQSQSMLATMLLLLKQEMKLISLIAYAQKVLNFQKMSHLNHS